MRHAEFSKRTTKTKSARPTKNMREKCNYSHRAGVMREGFASSFDLSKMRTTPLFLCPFSCVSYMRAATESSWSMELLSFASRLFAPKLLDHLLTTYVCHSNPFFLASERNGRNRPLREAPCTVLVTLSGPNRAGPDPFIFLCQARWTL